MGNCISSISKNHLFAFEKKMKNGIRFCKGKARSGIKMCATGKKYTGSIPQRSIHLRLTHYKLRYGGKTFFKIG